MTPGVKLSSFYTSLPKLYNFSKPLRNVTNQADFSNIVFLYYFMNNHNLAQAALKYVISAAWYCMMSMGLEVDNLIVY